MANERGGKQRATPILTAIEGGKYVVDGSTALDAAVPRPELLQRALAAIDVAIEQATPGARPAVALALAARLVALASHMLKDSTPSLKVAEAVDGSSNLITAEEAARIAGVTRRWIYDHTKGQRFRRELSRKSIRLDEVGFRRWLEYQRP